MKIGERIKFLRMKKELLQEDLAKAIHSTKQAIYKYENGIVTNIPMDKIEMMAKVLDVSPAYLMGWEEDENNKSPPGQKEKTASEDGLSDAQRALIQFARTVPEDKAELILRVMKSILEDG
jgi:transcriptional regulator with XRE-family HTH domain